MPNRAAAAIAHLMHHCDHSLDGYYTGICYNVLFMIVDFASELLRTPIQLRTGVALARGVGRGSRGVPQFGPARRSIWGYAWGIGGCAVVVCYRVARRIGADSTRAGVAPRSGAPLWRGPSGGAPQRGMGIRPLGIVRARSFVSLDKRRFAHWANAGRVAVSHAVEFAELVLGQREIPALFAVG